MFQITDPTCEARLLQLQDRLQESDTRRRIRAAQPVPAIKTQTATGTLGRLASLLGALARDSRDTLRTKEQDLAGWGVTWTQDPAQDEALALELQAARDRRQARAASPAVPSGVPAAPATGLRWAIGSALVRAGERLEGLPRPVAAD